MLTSILVGLLLSMVTIAIHAVGTTWWLWILSARNSKSTTISFGLQLRQLCSTALVLLSLHFIEASIWAVTYLQVDSDSLQSMEEAVYFSFVTFGSLGYGDIVIDSPWRLMGGIQSMTGLLVFGWSTAFIYALVRDVWKKRLPETPH